MISSKEKTILGQKYLCTQFTARRALKIKTKLFKLLGPSVSSFLGSAKGKDFLNSEINSDLLSKSVLLLIEKLDEDYVIDLILEILSSTRRNGREIDTALFDMEYAGNFNELFKAIVFVLEVNFGDFLRGLLTGKSLMENPVEAN
jgi:hypothetical protein